MPGVRQVSEDNKLVARYVAKKFGGKPQVVEWIHNTEPIAIDLLWCDDSPNNGLTSYGTIGVSDVPLKWRDGEFASRLELVGAFPSGEKAFQEILGAAAFNIMRSRKLYYPGSVMPDYVKEWYPNSSVPHLYFTSPSLWSEGSFAELEVGSKKVNWLQVFPISTTEYEYLAKHGEDALENLFVKNDVDIFDIRRPSVV